MSSILMDVRQVGIVARTLSLRSRIVWPYAETPLQRAKRRAYQQFAARYPIWVNALFDLHFLNTTAAPLVARCANSQMPPIAEEFVLAWWSQFSRHTISPSEMTAALPAAAAFIHLLEAELARSVHHGPERHAASPTRSELPPNPSDLLVTALHESSNLEMDWLWVATRLSDPIEQRYCYQRALNINPDSEVARKGLERR